MLREHFYTVRSTSKNENNSFVAVVSLNSDHDIFKGHFPGLPVVPGVCMLGMIKELLEDNVNRKLRLQSAAAIKFLSLINPLENSEVEISIKYSRNDMGDFVADGVISASNNPYFKITRAVYS